jgi:hypothetical protein
LLVAHPLGDVAEGAAGAVPDGAVLNAPEDAGFAIQEELVAEEEGGAEVGQLDAAEAAAAAAAAQAIADLVRGAGASIDPSTQ